MNVAGMHVLLVDDDPFSLDTMGMILEMDGYLVSCARCKRKALEYLDQKTRRGPTVDLMVVDLEMSNQSGIELIGEMKDLGHSVPVLVVTEFTSKHTVIDLLRKGVMDYLDKPIPMQEFRQRIDHMADSIKRRRESPRRLVHTGPEASPPRSESAAPAAPAKTFNSFARSASTVDTSDFGLPSSFRSYFPSQAGGVAALACRRDYGCDLLVAEVEGGSLESFYQSVLIKSCFDHHRQSGYDGHAFIRFLNKSLLEGSLGKLPTNVLFARIFLEQKRMEMISAGHPFLTYLSATGAQPRSFLASGDPLGLSEDIRIEPRVFPFESGDRIFLHTRSLAVAARSESLGGGDRARLGPERLDDLIMAYRKGNLDAMVEKIWQHVLDASRTRSNHDMFFWGIQIP